MYSGHCEGGAGCVQLPDGCDDGNPCTADLCSNATGCSHGAASCDDGNPCTVDMCDILTGCAHLPAMCSGKPCAANQCSGAKCSGSWFGGRCLHAVSSASTTWLMAKAGCEAAGRQLVSIHSAAENQFLQQLAAGQCTGSARFMVGLYSPTAVVGKSAWTDGSAVDLLLWAYGTDGPTKAWPANVKVDDGLWFVQDPNFVESKACYVCSGL